MQPFANTPVVPLGSPSDLMIDSHDTRLSPSGRAVPSLVSGDTAIWRAAAYADLKELRSVSLPIEMPVTFRSEHGH